MSAHTNRCGRSHAVFTEHAADNDVHINKYYLNLFLYLKILVVCVFNVIKIIGRSCALN